MPRGLFTPIISDPADAPPPSLLATSDAYLSASATIWARVEPKLGSDCFDITSFNLKVEKPAVANPPEDIPICDDNNDGFYDFDFNTLRGDEILGTQSPGSYSISYYKSLLDATTGLSVNELPFPYTNEDRYRPETIFARISNTGFSECFDVTSFTIQVFETARLFSPSEIPDFSVCDDDSDSDDTNGIYTFDLTDYESLIFSDQYQSKSIFDVTYFEEPTYTNEIPNITTYRNSAAGGNRIYVMVTNNSTCPAYTSFNLEVKSLPNALLTPFDFIQCDVDGTPDGIVDFNLAEADSFLTFGNTSLDVSYYLSPIDAASGPSGLNPQNKYPFSNAGIQTIYGRVEDDATGCYRVVPVNLEVSVESFPSEYSYPISHCDDDDVIDGLHVFDLTRITSEIFAIFSNKNLRPSFYRNESDALEEVNYINTPDVYLSEKPFSQQIWVRVESALSGGCFAIAPVIELTVNPRPEFELEEVGFVCLNNLPLIVKTYDPNDFYTYEWTDSSDDVISRKDYAEIKEGGVYTVVATSTSSSGCRSFPKTITIEESDIATLEPKDVIVIDNSRNNVLEVITSNQNLGVGDYEFSLNDSFGPYQDSPVFFNVIPGKQTLFVKDKNDCGIAQVEVFVFGFPNFFTPNNDRSNDTWQVRGVDQAVFPESKITIYNRYGKLLSRFGANDPGWDGTIGNIPAISTDYWYIVELKDVNGKELIYKGHFSLVRR